MKREELLAKGYTEEQVTDLLNTFHSINKENDRLKGELLSKSELENKYNEAQRKLDDINKANLSVQEQMELDKKETAKNLAESKKILNKAKASQVLSGLDIDDEIIDNLVTEDEATTLKNANLLKEKFDIFRDTVEKQTRANITSLDVKPNPTNIPQGGEDVMTVEKFKSMTLTEQVFWKRENADEYRQLFPEN